MGLRIVLAVFAFSLFMRESVATSNIHKPVNDIEGQDYGRKAEREVQRSLQDWLNSWTWVRGKLTLKSFSWEDCGDSGDLGKLTSLSVSPDPLQIPGNVTVSASGSLGAKLKSPISLSLDIQKKMFIWVTLPCIDDLGSCDYEDVCPLLAQIECPPGIPCHCPFPKGHINVPKTTLTVESISIPSWLQSGDYQVQASVRMAGQKVSCVKLAFSLG